MNTEQDIENCIEALRNGEVVLYPTDTVWGLGCDATNATAVAKLLAIKNRQEAQGLIIIVADVKEIFNYTDSVDDTVFTFIRNTFKPTTLIFENGKNVAPPILNADGTIAIRAVRDEFCKKVVAGLGKPIVSTSANLHTEATPKCFAEINPVIKEAVNYVVEHRQQEPASSGNSSVMVKWLGTGRVKVVRSSNIQGFIRPREY